MAKAAQLQVTTKHERRAISPYVTPDGLDEVLSETVLVVDEREIHNEQTEVFSADLEPKEVHLALRLDAHSIREYLEGWILEIKDLSVLVLAEIPFLGMLDIQAFKISELTPTEAESEYQVQLPEWVSSSIGHGRVVVRAYLVAASNDVSAVEQEIGKGTALASWHATLLDLQETNWFRPRVLTPEIREKLEEQAGLSISPSVLAFVRAENLLVPGSLGDSVTCYVNPSVARFLDTSGSTPAVELVENQILYLVMDRIFESLCDELEDARPSSIEGLAAEPILELIADLQKIAWTDVLDCMMGSPLEKEALKSHLQQAAGLLRAGRSALRGE